MIDLHMHSTVSDGLLSPEALIEGLARAGIETLAVTDHDDIRGYEHATARAYELGLRLLPGCEISTQVGPLGVHILAYGFDPKSVALLDLLARQRAAKRRQIGEMLGRLRENAIHLELEDLLEGRPPDSYVGRTHIANALVPAVLKRVSTVFHRYIGDGCPAYVAPVLAPAEEVIATVHEAGGLAVLAHPSWDDLSLALPRLIDWGLDGLELYRPRGSNALFDAIVSAAYRNALFVTGGSDWHGHTERQALGSFSVPEDKLKDFLERLE